MEVPVICNTVSLDDAGLQMKLKKVKPKNRWLSEFVQART